MDCTLYACNLYNLRYATRRAQPPEKISLCFYRFYNIDRIYILHCTSSRGGKGQLQCMVRLKHFDSRHSTDAFDCRFLSRPLPCNLKKAASVFYCHSAVPLHDFRYDSRLAKVAFGRGDAFLYFFFNYFLPSGFLGFSNEMPYIPGSFYWIVFMLFSVIGIGTLYRKVYSIKSK